MSDHRLGPFVFDWRISLASLLAFLFSVGAVATTIYFRPIQNERRIATLEIEMNGVSRQLPLPTRVSIIETEIAQMRVQDANERAMFAQLHGDIQALGARIDRLDDTIRR